MTDWEANIDQTNDKVTVTYTDRTEKPFTHITVSVYQKKVTITTKCGSTVEQRMVLRNKTIDEVTMGLKLIDCPERHVQFVERVLDLLAPSAAGKA